jgi:predicted HTH transcriptional regulator
MVQRGLALCEQTGSGLRMMLAQWVKQGHLEPEYANDRGRKSFEFRLPPTGSKKMKSLARR